MKFFKRLPQLAAAALFAVSASAAVLMTDATHAGQPAQGLLASAPQAASAQVAVGIGIGVGGPYRYPRYAYRGGAWVRVGFGYAAAPGYVGGYYVGYAPPPILSSLRRSRILRSRLLRPSVLRPSVLRAPVLWLASIEPPTFEQLKGRDSGPSACEAVLMRRSAQLRAGGS